MRRIFPSIIELACIASFVAGVLCIGLALGG